MLRAAKHLAFSATYEDEILRQSPQDDVASQSPRGEGWVTARQFFLESIIKLSTDKVLTSPSTAVE
jgi:hypothetical protein